jgi:hypothetical protein
MSEYSKVVEIDLLPVHTYTLEQNYPNPFNPSTKIKFSIPENSAGITSLKIYDVLGNEVAALFNEEEAEGNYEFEFDASKLASGIYMYKLQNNEYIFTRKMLLLK